MSSNIEYPKVCTLCGVRFTAKKLSTQYCSHKCSQRAYKQRNKTRKLSLATEDIRDLSRPPILRNSENTHFSNPFDANSPNLNTKEFLSLTETAKLLGVGKTTIHRYCVQGKLKCIKMNRKIFIRRKDIEGLFDYAPIYQVTRRTTPLKPKIARPPEEVILATTEQEEPITDFYSAAEVAQKYGVSKSTVHKSAAKYAIPKILYQGCILYSRKHIDERFTPKIDNTGIEQWYSSDDIKRIYQMTTSAIYSIVCEHQVPRKNLKGKSLYSKQHIDHLLAHRLQYNDIEEWYSKEDIDREYGLSQSYISGFAHKYKIPRKRDSGRGYYSKTHFDEAMKQYKPSVELITIERAMSEYSLSREQLNKIVRTHNITKAPYESTHRVARQALEKIINPPKLYDNGSK